MIIGVPDDREVIRKMVAEIKELYKEVIHLRNEDRQKYKDMCARLETLEKERSKRLRKHSTVKKDRTKRKEVSKNAKVQPDATKKKNDGDAGTKTDEKGPEKEE
uniref:DZF domain-containing protein n=1 Tax=Caenorhabditis tropicalis TaxID=1561998 RepID=A0A1I7SYF5_9PELO